MKKDTKDMEKLLTEGVDINGFGLSGQTPLTEVCRHNADPAIVSFLLQNGADVKKRGKDGETALIELGRSQKTYREVEAVLCALLDYGADINESDNAGYTGLFNATLNLSNPETINVFLRHGANLWQPNSKGITPAERICSTTKDAECVKNCLGNVINIQYMFYLFISNGRMADFWGNWNKETVAECIKLFLQKGLDINYQDKEGMTALMYFCKNNSKDRPQGKNGSFFEKIMHQSDLNTAAEVIKILLQHGARTDLKNYQGKTAFDLCNDKKELLEALREEK